MKMTAMTRAVLFDKLATFRQASWRCYYNRSTDNFHALQQADEELKSIMETILESKVPQQESFEQTKQEGIEDGEDSLG